MSKRRVILKKILLVAIPLTLTALWVAFIWSNSLKTGVESGEQSGRVHAIISSISQFLGFDLPISEYFIRKAAHFTEFAVLGALFAADLICWGVVRLRKPLYVSILFLLACVPTSTLFATTDEFLQSLTAGRGPSVKDVLIDTSGALFAVLLFIGVFVLIRFLQRKKEKNESTE